MAMTYTVPGSADDALYRVTAQPGGGYSCTCPDYMYRRAPRGAQCKHIRRIDTALRAQRAKDQARAAAAAGRAHRAPAISLDDLYA